MVHPLGRLGVSLDLQILRQLLVAYCPSFFQEEFELPEDEGVALDGGGVMGLLGPDVPPDVLSFDRGGWAAKTIP